MRLGQRSCKRPCNGAKRSAGAGRVVVAQARSSWLRLGWRCTIMALSGVADAPKDAPEDASGDAPAKSLVAAATLVRSAPAVPVADATIDVPLSVATADSDADAEAVRRVPPVGPFRPERGASAPISIPSGRNEAVVTLSASSRSTGAVYFTPAGWNAPVALIRRKPSRLQGPSKANSRMRRLSPLSLIHI